MKRLRVADALEDWRAALRRLAAATGIRKGAQRRAYDARVAAADEQPSGETVEADRILVDAVEREDEAVRDEEAAHEGFRTARRDADQRAEDRERPSASA